MVIRMKLKSEPFGKIEDRTKTVELRLLDEKRKGIKVGDYIEFTNLSTNEIVLTKVLGLTTANSFEDLFSKITDKVSMGFSENMTIQDMASVMDKYYSKDEQTQLGVVAIKIDAIFSTADILKITKLEDGKLKDLAQDFYLMHDAVDSAFKTYRYNRQEFGDALAYMAFSLLEIGNATGYDVFEEVEKALKRNKEGNYTPSSIEM